MKRIPGICTNVKIWQNITQHYTAGHTLLFNESRVAISIFSLKHQVYREANKSFLQYTGYSEEELIGQPGITLWADGRERERYLKRIQTTGTVENFEFRYRKKNGTVGVALGFGKLMELDGEQCILSENFDITHQKELEATAVRYEQMLQNLTENLPGFIYSYQLGPGKHEGFLYASTGVRKLYDIEPEILQSDLSKVRNLMPEEDRYHFEIAIAESARKNMLFHREFRIHHPQKGERWLETRAVPEAQVDGSTIWHGITLDVTERKQQQELLLKKEREFRSLAENAQDPIYRYDRDCRRIYINPAVERISGKSAATLLGKTPEEAMIIPAEENKKVMESIQKALKNGQTDEIELLFILPDGSKRFYRHNHIPEFGPDGKVESVLAIGQDITAQKQLHTREEMFRTLAENSPNIIMRYDMACRCVYVNPAYTQQTGIPVEVAIQTTPESQWSTYLTMLTMNAKEYQHAICRVINTGETDRFTLDWYRLNDDGYVVHDMQIIAERNGDGVITGALVIGHDVTEQKAIEKQLMQQEATLKEAQRIAKVGSWKLDFPDQNLWWSHEIYRIFEIDPKTDKVEAYEHFLKLVHPDDRDHLDAIFSDSLKNKTPYDFEHRLLMRDGRIKYVHEKGMTHYDAQGNPIQTIGTVQDITQQKSTEQKIEYMAHHDALTCLPNRILVKDRTEQAIAYAKRHDSKIALLFIDLDGFKTINDSLGHFTGDAILQEVSSRLKECVRESDTVGRLGGDEFLIILSDLNALSDIAAVTDKLLREFEHPFRIHGHSLFTSASIGIAIFPDNADTFETLLQNADMAMYKAKEQGKNTYCFHTPQMQEDLIEQFTIQNDLKNALRDNDLLLHYQPQINLAGNRITGTEALIRWKHPTKGMIPPSDFIPIAESSGLIVSIGEWVIREACRQLAEWQEGGIHITVAVNISSVQFQRGNLENIVKEALLAYRIDPKYLELELTESIMIHDAENTLQAVRNLKALGVKLSIDDFGTGYSSLAYLKRFAVDKIKIDQSFIRDIQNDQDDEMIVRAIIQMAKSLNLKTTAEGVENAGILSLINSFGCDEAQGFHFAKPLEATEFTRYFRQRTGFKST